MHFFLLPILLAFSQISSIHAYEDPILKVTKQAHQGNLIAQLELANAYEHGQGIKKDSDKAIKWYCRAATHGSVDAQRDLAWMLLNARGIEKNEALAIRWFKIAAKSGDQYSKKMLIKLDTSNRTTEFICKYIPIAYWESKKCKKSCQNIVEIVNKISADYDIDAQLILSVIQYESNFNTKAQSNKNARGLMQLIPATAKRFGVKDVWDPEQNIKGGTRYLNWLLKQYDGNVIFALAGYNAGENAVQKYKGVPPYKETRHYVKRIIKLYGKDYHPVN